MTDLDDRNNSSRDENFVEVGDTSLFVEERGSGMPLIVLHGGPGLDHHMFGDYLDGLADEFRLILADQRSQGKSLEAQEGAYG